MGPLISLGLLGLILWGAGLGGYKMAMLSPASRQRVLWSSGSALAVIIAIVAYITPRIPETPGSPGTLVMLTILWLLGGCGGILALATVIGAAIAKPPSEDERYDEWEEEMER